MLTKETHDLILDLHAQGMPKLGIAYKLNLTHKTVNKHIKNPIWKPYKRVKKVKIDNENKKDKIDKIDKIKGLSIAAYEDRMMKSRTGCT
jgi:IS30 family transposase